MRAKLTVARMWADSTYATFTDSLVELMAFSQKVLCGKDEYIHYDKASFSWHSGARNELVSRAEGEWLLQLDSDHAFAPDVLTRLLRVAEKERVNIVSAIYQYKAPPHGPVAGLWDAEGRLVRLEEFDREAESIDVGAVGAGCLLVRTSLFKRMRAAFKCEPFDTIGQMSEDFSFCKRAVEMGERILLCPQIQAHHTIRTHLHIEDYPKQAGLKTIRTQGGRVLPDENEKAPGGGN